jgi:hypothetical protein
LGLIAVFAANSVLADCTNPAGVPGEIFYNADQNVPQVCAGSTWYPLGKLNPSAGGSGCSNPTGTEGQMFYNVDYHVPQYCDGDDWREMISIIGGASGGGGIIPGYFVRTDGSYNGNLGGLSGADATCLSELQTYDWKGKSNAGTLTAARVKAWLCDSSTCNDFVPGNIYIMAKANSPTSGGSALYVAADGSSPGDGGNWNGPYQLTSATYWTGRGSISNFFWALTPDADTCSDWSTTSGNGMRARSYSSGSGRWSDGILACSNSQELLCMVHPEGFDPCAGSPSPGDVCADGSIYAGSLSGTKLFVPPADNSSGVTWNNGTTSWTVTGATSATDGTANTATLDGLADAGSPHQAAKLCAALSAHGHTDWYLPAQDELNVLYTNKAAIGGFNESGSAPAGWYWSSSEFNNFNAWRQDFSDGFQGPSGKNNGLSVRCVRR